MQKMINFDDITKENMKEPYPNNRKFQITLIEY